MTRSRRFARISLSSARWLLPWIAILFVSATLAYGMNTVIGGSASEETAAATSREQSATLSTSALADGDDVRAQFLASTATAATHDDTLAARTSGGTFGITSMTSPASTGHASPDGCCTWN